MIDIRHFGAVGDGITLDTIAIQKAIDSATEQGGGTVLIPPGRWLTGALCLGNHTQLFLDAGAMLLGSRNKEDYPVMTARWEGRTQQCHSPLIGGNGLSDVGIRGPGAIDGQGEPWWLWFKEGQLDFPRPRLVSLTDCRNVVLEDFTAINSPSWTINPVRCRGVSIRGISILNPPDSPNTDGINPDSCSVVRISDCFVSVGDDCITIKAGTELESDHLKAPCEDITIANCVLEKGHGGVVIGSEMSGGIRNIAITNCIFKGTDRGIRIKSRRGRGGMVEDIIASNLVMVDVLSPLTVNLYYGCGAWGDEVVSDKGYRPVGAGTPRIRNLSFSGIRARGARVAAAFIYGLPEMPVVNVSLRDYSVSMAEGCDENIPAEMADGLPDMCRHGIWVRNVEGLSLSNIHIEGFAGEAIDIDASVSLAGS